MGDVELTAYCGLYCGDCIRFKSKASALASDLLNELETAKFGDYAKVKQSQISDFQHFEVMLKLLGHISQLICEVPCRQGGDGCIDSCQIIECVKEKSFEGCWECTDYVTCEKLEFLKPFHGDTPLNNLHKIKELGIHAWAKHRGKCYHWSE